MTSAELLKDTLFLTIELHTAFFVLILALYANMRKSFLRNSRENETPLTIVYVGAALMVVSDCAWTCMSSMDTVNTYAAYLVNLMYFLSSSAASAYWFLFCVTHLDTRVSKYRLLLAAIMIPYVAVSVCYLLSPLNGLIFTIRSGAYVRGSLFFLDPIIKLGYVGAASVFALRSGRKKQIAYLRKKDFSFALFAVPVLVCGSLQVLTGSDFNCLGVTAGLILMFATGITNPDSENTDAIYSLANSFEASYIVNMDTGHIRPLRKDIMHDVDMLGMESTDFTTHFQSVLAAILLPEDRTDTLNVFTIPYVEKRFRFDSSFSIRYRVREKNGLTEMHTASFIRAIGEEEKREFLLGINTIHPDSLLYERNEVLQHENQRLEQINAGIIESVAKIVEARDGGSGEHIVRVRKLTEIIAREIMTDFPEYHLDEAQVKLIASASVLHDVGKIAIPDAILLKPGRLTEEEFNEMKTHTTKGCDILNLFPLGLDDAFLDCALSICRWHHEKYDGKGYPDGLAGEAIPIAAQIVAVADCFDALVSERPYKNAIPPEIAIEMIQNGECGAFSLKVLHVLECRKGKLMEVARLHP